MPEVREAFERYTRTVHPEPGALERQHRRQRRHRVTQRATVFAVAACMIALIGIAAGSGWSHPAHEPAGTTTSTPSTPRPILVSIDPTTGAVEGRVVGDVSPAFRGSVSPDGSRVVFVRDVKGHEQLFVTTPSGRPTRVTGADMGGCGCGSFDPAWSPDGREIAFAGIGLSGNQDIYVVDVGAGTTRRITRDPSVDGMPTWSPDGRTIAFTRGQQAHAALWIVDLSNGRLRLVTNREGGDDPAWSPDGATIAFSGSAANASGSDLWLVHPDGSGLRRLADAAVQDASPTWSPDGSHIAFAAFRSDARPPVTDIDVVDVGTGHVVVLASGLDDPAWSPAGTSILALRP